MSLELLVGPYRSGKTSIAVVEALAFSRENPLIDSVIITPSGRYRSLIQEKVCQSSRKDSAAVNGIMGLRFETFDDFVRKESIASGMPAVILSKRMRNKLLAHVLQKLNRQKRLPHLGRIAEMRGTASAVLALIDEFQRAAYTPDEIIDILKSKSDADSRHAEFAQIYSSYQQELKKRDCLDEKFQAMQLCRSLEQTAVGTNYGIIIFDGFDRYSQIHSRLAKGLASRAQKVFVLFDYVQGSKDYVWKEKSYQMLKLELGVEPRNVPARKHNAASLDSFTSLDRFTEMQEIARQAKILIATEQASPQDILVTARHIRSYQTAATAAFEDFHIPYFLDRSYPAKTFPVMHFVLALLGLHVNDFLRQDVMAVLSSHYFKKSAHKFTDDDIKSIDRESLEDFVLKGRTDWDRCFKDSNLKINLDNLFEELTPLAGSRTLSSHCRWCEDKLERLANFEIANIPDNNAGNCLVVLRNAFAALIEEERVMAYEPVDYSSFYQSLEEILDTSNFPGCAAGNDCVTVCSAEHVPNRTYKVVFVAGMLEGEFPAKDGHFGFAGRENLDAWWKRGVLVDNPRTHPGFEDALLKMIMQSASSKIFMSCPRYDTKIKDREELLPSFTLKEFFGDVSPRYLPVYEEALKSPCSLKDVTSAILWHAPYTNMDTLGSKMPKYAKDMHDLQACIAPSKTRLAATRKSCLNGYLVDLVESGALSVKLPEYLSATSLDYYGKCPFRFWATTVLKLEPREEVDPRNQYKLSGIFYHHVMEEFYNRVIERGIAMRQENKAQLKLLFDTAVSNGFVWLESEPEFHADEFWTYRQKFMRLLLDKFFEHEISSFSTNAPGLEPYQCEAAFGKGGKFPALELKSADGHTISIRGKIDRIDLDKERAYARIVDYKRSASGLNVTAIRTAQALQLPLYSLALTDVIVPGCKVNRVEYAVVSTAESKALDGTSSIANSMDNARQRIQEYEVDICKGNFLVQPTHDSYCRTCPQHKICRITELPTTGLDNGFAN